MSDLILEAIAFWASIFAAVYFFKKGQKTAGWVSIANIVLLPVLVGAFFALTNQLPADNRRSFVQAPAKNIQQEVERPTQREEIKSMAMQRHEERLALVNEKLLNPEYGSSDVVVDKNDESTIWDDAVLDQKTLELIKNHRVGYVEKINDRGEFIVSVVSGNGNGKILSLFHVIPIYGGDATYFSGLNNCEKEQQLQFLRKHVVGKKIVLTSDISFCGLSEGLFLPAFLAEVKTDGTDAKFFIRGIGLMPDNGAQWSSPLDQRLASDGYLKGLPGKGCTQDEPLAKSVEVAKIRRDGFWGTCK